MKPEIYEVVAHLRADKKFCRQIGYDSDVISHEGANGLDPAVEQSIANSKGEGHVPIILRGYLRKSRSTVKKVVDYVRLERFSVGGAVQSGYFRILGHFMPRRHVERSF